VASEAPEAEVIRRLGNQAGSRLTETAFQV